MVRVGGGYIAIDDFIDQYTFSEVDKIERHDVIDRFKSKTILQNYANTQAVNAVETNPIKLSRSPGKLRKSGTRF